MPDAEPKAPRKRRHLLRLTFAVYSPKSQRDLESGLRGDVVVLTLNGERLQVLSTQVDKL